MPKFTVSDLPEGDFHFSQICDKFYGECLGIDTEGRTYNMASATVVRLLRKMPGVLELKNGNFYNGNISKICIGKNQYEIYDITTEEE